MAGRTNSPHACDRVLSVAMQPWAIERDMLAVVASVLAHRLAGDTLDTATLEKRAPAAPTRGGGVAVIPIHGVIAPRMNLLSEISGGATYEGAAEALNQAVAAKDVSTIVFDVDSPGGSVLGATEFARSLRAARESKHLIAHAHYQMASAAYWIAAGCHEIVASPSAMVGSIGVYSIHEDLSAALEQLGVKLTYISAGKYKVEGNDTQPLTDSARAHLQATVNSFYGRFVADVAKGRGVSADVVRAGYGEGRLLTAEDALAANLVDRLDTFEDCLAGVLPSNTPVFAADANPPALPAVPQEPAKATGPQRAVQARAAQQALLSLGFATR
jgi:signal peptide peptidase SppA